MSGPKNHSTVVWWIGWILLTILSFFVSCYFWTGVIARYIGPMQKPGVPILWVTAVFGSWMALLVPLIIAMYNQVDKAYEDARMAREAKELEKTKSALKIKSILIDASERTLRKDLTEKLKTHPETIKRGHLVTLTLRDGRKIENVFVLNKKEILGVYGMETLPFRAADIADLEPVGTDRLPDFKPERWLRLDGVGMEN